ncbi:hypothetical protein BIY24_14480 [Halobacteriovorax marinus]|nr:hypothetical protein BIY24_14480 [Halobacteriovorax marinus]
MKPILFINQSNVWSWDRKKWIGQLIGNGIYRTNGKIVFTLNPKERLPYKRGKKLSHSKVRPPKPTRPSKRNLPDKEIQITPSSRFVDWKELIESTELQM